MTTQAIDIREPPDVSGDDGGTGHLEELPGTRSASCNGSGTSAVM